MSFHVFLVGYIVCFVTAWLGFINALTINSKRIDRCLFTIFLIGAHLAFIAGAYAIFVA